MSEKIKVDRLQALDLAKRSRDQIHKVRDMIFWDVITPLESLFEKKFPNTIFSYFFNRKKVKNAYYILKYAALFKKTEIERLNDFIFEIENSTSLVVLMDKEIANIVKQFGLVQEKTDTKEVLFG